MNYFLDYIRNMLSPYGMTTLESIGFRISIGVGILFTVLYTYQFMYVFIACIKKPKVYPATDQTKHYAILIAARNEEKVIPQLLKSIQGQTYPKDLIDIYVIADNCTDRTADVCREMGESTLGARVEMCGRAEILLLCLPFLLELFSLALGLVAA